MEAECEADKQTSGPRPECTEATDANPKDATIEKTTVFLGKGHANLFALDWLLVAESFKVHAKRGCPDSKPNVVERSVTNMGF